MNAPTLKLLGEPSARGAVTWSPTLIRAAELAADSGDFRLAAELWETMLGADDRIRAVVDTRTDSLLGRPLSFDLGTGRRNNAVVRDLEGAHGDWWFGFPESELKQIHSWVIGLNIGLAQIVWSKRNGRDVPRIYARSPRFLRWDWPTRQWRLTVADGASTKEITITPGDGEWLLFTPAGESRPWIHGAYRALSRWTLLKQYALQDWGYYSERHGQGTLVAEAEQVAGQSMGVAANGAAANKAKRDEISADLQDLGANSAIALPPGFKLRLLEATSRTWESFKAQIEMADNGAAVTVLGQNLTTQAGDTGAQGAASEHGKVAHGRTKFDNEWQSTGYRTQVLEWYAEFNYGARDLAPWPLRDVALPEDEKAKAAVRQMNAQADSTLVAAKIMSVNEARERNGLSRIVEDDGTADSTNTTPIFRYDLEFQTVTINERRRQLGLKPMRDGDRPAVAPAQRGDGAGGDEGANEQEHGVTVDTSVPTVAAVEADIVNEVAAERDALRTELADVRAKYDRVVSELDHAHTELAMAGARNA